MRDDRVRAEQVRDLYRNAPVGVASALLGVVVLAWLLLHLDPTLRGRMGVWLALTVASAAWQLGLCALYWRARPADAQWRPWAARFTVASAVEGARWGLATVWLAPSGRLDEQLWILLVVSSAASGSASSLGSFTPAFYALLFPAVSPFILVNAADPEPVRRIAGAMVLIFLVSVALLGRGQGRRLFEALRLRFENLDLAEDLERQKALADAANGAKTRFLASASHDLRQPVHALSLFVEALRLRPLDGASAELAEHIAETAGALEGLFDGLLDISQLDAGLIRPHPTVFLIQPMLARLHREFEPEVRRRGVDLRLRPCSAAVRADPILLERVLRNLLSNAARYTEKGRIVLGCRRGPRLRVCVVDTGPGIPEREQERVFEEFHQLGNPQRDRANGLGLGLSISLRTARLMDCPLVLASTPGRGTAISLSLAPADPADIPQPAVAVSDVSVLSSGLLCVVDDDEKVRRGAQALLTHWGFDVVAAATGVEAERSLVDGGRAPDLVICDWRLGGGEDAAAVARRLRTRYGSGLPVLVLTGDVSATLAEASRRDRLELLHKPLSGGRLRAAVGAALRRASEG